MSTWTRHVCSTFLAGLAIALLAGCGGAPREPAARHAGRLVLS